jgi:hypothetical protein
VTYNPPTLRDLGRYWTAHGGVNLGVVGDTRHQAKGTSYHLGASQLTATAYSRRTTRDRAGLTEAASAIDLGKLNGSFGPLRTFSKWLVKRCQLNSPGTQDIREVIYTDDGKRVLRWDRERGVASAPRTGEADNSHLTHTHVSFYRDSEKRPKIGAFSPYFTPAQPAPIQEAPVATGNRLTDAIVVRAGYLANELAAGDNEGALLQIAKINEFNTRILVSIAGVQLDDPELSDQPGIAVHQLLAATGHPTTIGETEPGRPGVLAPEPEAVIADATPLQVQELALLGFFGHIGTRPDVDYSLKEQYYRHDAIKNIDILLSDTPDTLTSENYWAQYLASKS